MTTYPNREHKNADSAARRRALRALGDIENEILVLRRRIDAGTADGDDAQIMTDRVREVVKNISILGALREVREWDAADKAEREG